MTAPSLFIGLLTFLGFLLFEFIRPPAGIPPLRLRGYDFFAAFLLAGNLVQFYLFLTRRSDGLAVLEEGLSIGNISALIWTSAAACYLAYVFLTGRFRISWLFCTPYSSIFLLIAVYFTTTLWSITFSYTLYRGIELIVWISLAVYFFTRLESNIDKVMFLAVYCIIWCLMDIQLLFENLSNGIVFSAIKENILPAVAFSVIVFGWSTRLRAIFCFIGVLTFIFAGSAASFASAIAVCFVALVFDRSMGLKLVGYVGALFSFVLFVTFLIVPDQFPDAVELLSYILQKPPTELLAATGRYRIWEIFWTATQNQYFGSGFCTDRFIQLIAGLGEASVAFESDTINIYSAHNAILAAWVSAGWPGVVALLFANATGIHFCAKFGGKYRASTTMTLAFIALNSLTIPGLGGYYSASWLVWIAALSIAGSQYRAKVTQPGALFRRISRLGFIPERPLPLGAKGSREAVGNNFPPSAQPQF